MALPVDSPLIAPGVARLASSQALVTDASSTSIRLRAAAECFSVMARISWRASMAGKEISGIAAADASCFAARIRTDAQARRRIRGEPRDPRVTEFVALIKKLGRGARLAGCEAHDRAAAIVSHLPQLLAVALAGVVRDQTDETDCL